MALAICVLNSDADQELGSIAYELAFDTGLYFNMQYHPEKVIGTPITREDLAKELKTFEKRVELPRDNLIDLGTLGLIGLTFVGSASGLLYGASRMGGSRDTLRTRTLPAVKEGVTPTYFEGWPSSAAVRSYNKANDEFAWKKQRRQRH